MTDTEHDVGAWHDHGPQHMMIITAHASELHGLDAASSGQIAVLSPPAGATKL